MEPMALGSAPSSPASPSTNPNFLPAFLMGDTSQQTTPNNPNISPGRNPAQNLRKLAFTNTPEGRSGAYSKSFTQQNIESPVLKQGFTPHRPGPPSQGLFDSIEPTARNAPSPILHSTATNFDSPAPFNRSISRVHADDSFNFSRTMNETANLARLERIDTHWVTVYGFPPNALSVVLAQLSNCGVIVEKRVPSQGNWVHVKFNNLSDVPRALAMNGRCLNNCIMIGVSLYHNQENKENESNATFTSPARSRSLRQSFVSPISTNSVLPPQNVPQKSTGMVSKAIEYVFGW